MSKKIKDEMVHGDFCYWDDVSRSWLRYSLPGLTVEHLASLNEINHLKNVIKGREATIEGLQMDIRTLKNGSRS